MSAINIDNLTKIYRSNWIGTQSTAVSNISLTVDVGEAFGFIGPNGAGKSTTIKILTGAMKPTKGEVFLFGVPSRDPMARRGLGYVAENPSLPDFLTPLEILRMALKLHQVQLDDANLHCMNWLTRFNLDHVANKQLRGFSKGMSQRTALAHAMVVNPRLLILDEPLSGLDPVGRKDVIDVLMEYRQGGGTIFFSSHVLYDVERVADRYGLIHKGELKTVATPGELMGDDEMLTVRSIGAIPVEGMTQDSTGRWQGVVLRRDLWGMLQHLEKADHCILEIRPRLNLESAFLRYVQS